MMVNQTNLKLTGKFNLKYKILFTKLFSLFLVLKAEGLVKRSFFCKKTFSLN